MKVLKLEHLGISLRVLLSNQVLYSNSEIKHGAESLCQERNIVLFECGETELELVQLTSTDSVIQDTSRKKRGKGCIALHSEWITLSKRCPILKQKGVKLIDESPLLGGGGAKIVFLEPESAFSVIHDLVEKSWQYPYLPHNSGIGLFGQCHILVCAMHGE